VPLAALPEPREGASLFGQTFGIERPRRRFQRAGV